MCRARLHRGITPPCALNWREHLRRSTADRTIQSHVCALGLHCTCVPIYIGSSLVGAARLVQRPETVAARPTRVAATLALAVTLACQEGYVAALLEQMTAMERRIHGLIKLGNGAVSRHPSMENGNGQGRCAASCVRKALRLLDSRYHETELGLSGVAAAVSCNPKYLARVFHGTVGVRMHSYLMELRLGHACRQLVSTDRLIKEIAFDCGFRDVGGLGRAFRRHFGVSPGKYRVLFDGRHPDVSGRAVARAPAAASSG